MKFFTDTIVSMFDSMSVNIDSKSFVFITKNAYSAFQFARVYKFTSVHFVDMFDSKIFGYAKKSKIKCSFNEDLVDENNKSMFASFAKSHYNPIEKNNNELMVYSKHRSSGNQVVDISAYSKGDEYVFISNMRELTHIELHNTKIVGFSYDTSIFSGSKKIHKQLRIGSKKHSAKSVFPNYSADDIQKIMSGQGKMNFAHLKFLFKMMDDFQKMPMFSSMMGDLSIAAKVIKSSSFALDSMTKKEIFNPSLFANNQSRIKRIAEGAKVEEQELTKIISFLLMFNQYGIKGMIQELKSKSGNNSQVADLISKLGPLLSMLKR